MPITLRLILGLKYSEIYNDEKIVNGIANSKAINKTKNVAIIIRQIPN